MTIKNDVEKTQCDPLGAVDIQAAPCLVQPGSQRAANMILAAAVLLLHCAGLAGIVENVQSSPSAN